MMTAAAVWLRPYTAAALKTPTALLVRSGVQMQSAQMEHAHGMEHLRADTPLTRLGAGLQHACVRAGTYGAFAGLRSGLVVSSGLALYAAVSDCTLVRGCNAFTHACTASSMPSPGSWPSCRQAGPRPVNGCAAAPTA